MESTVHPDPSTVPAGAETESLAQRVAGVYRERILPTLRYLRRNRLMVLGMAILGGLTLAILLSYTFYRQTDLYGEEQNVNGLSTALSVPARLKPSWNPWGEFPLGTERTRS